MRNTRLPMGAIAILSLGGYLLPVPAIAQTRPAPPQTQPAPPFYTPGAPLPKQTAYDCGNAGAVTLTRDPKNLDRFTYEGVNTKGKKLTLRNGVGYANPERAVYIFYRRGNLTTIVDQEPSGKTTMTTTGGKGVSDTTASCKVTKVTRSASRK